MYGLFKINGKQLQQRKNKRIAVVISSPNELKRFSAASLFLNQLWFEELSLPYNNLQNIFVLQV